MLVKTKIVGMLCAIGLVGMSPALLASTPHADKQIGSLLPPDGRECVFFTLQGVPQADPVNPNNAWMTIPMSRAGFKESYALLLAAKLTGLPLTVVTTGAMACGYAEVHYLYAPG